MRYLIVLTGMLVACETTSSSGLPAKARVAPIESSTALDSAGAPRQTYLGAYSQALAVSFTNRRIEELTLSDAAAERRLACTFVTVAWLASLHPYLLAPAEWPAPFPRFGVRIEPAWQEAWLELADLLEVREVPLQVASSANALPRNIYEAFSERCGVVRSGTRFPIAPLSSARFGSVASAALASLMGNERPATLHDTALELTFELMQKLEVVGKPTAGAAWPTHVRVPSLRDPGSAKSYALLEPGGLSPFHEAVESLTCSITEVLREAMPGLWQEALTHMHGNKAASISFARPGTPGIEVTMWLHARLGGDVGGEAWEGRLELPLSLRSALMGFSFWAVAEQVDLDAEPLRVHLTPFDAADVLEDASVNGGGELRIAKAGAAPARWFALCDPSP